MDNFDRCRLLFGDDFHKLNKAKILLLGVGGVGSFCLDALWRSGVRNITIVDFDTFDITNQNRQIGSDMLGIPKVYRLSSLYLGVYPIMAKITPEWVQSFDFSSYDLVLDAIDDVKAKVALAHKCHKKLISSMGSAKRIDPTKITVTSVWNTKGDALARSVKERLKKLPVKVDYKVIYSCENPSTKNKGSFVCVTGAFGLALAASAVTKILSKPIYPH